MADSLALCRVCKGLDGPRNYMMKKISSINIHLKDFVDNPAMLRSQLRKYDALISGPFALNIFELGRQHVRYLDVFVHNGVNADQLAEYIQKTENYRNDNPDAETTQPRQIYCCSTRPNTKLRITRTDRSPLRTILTSSSTTACVNFITWNKAYSIFPRQTLINHQFYPLRFDDRFDYFGSTLKELSNQGWTARDIIWPDFPGAPKIDGLRRVGDNSTLVIRLDTNSVQPPSTPDFTIEYSQFRVSQPNGQRAIIFQRQPTDFHRQLTVDPHFQDHRQQDNILIWADRINSSRSKPKS
ncbi:hypothetical protein RB601_003668 [Gaeumannomyces tritici]